MNEAAIRKELVQLRNILTKTPKSPKPHPRSAPELDLSITAGRKLSTESFLDELRVLGKYVIFDLEATRRENRYLRQMLETRSKRDQEEKNDDDNRWGGENKK